MSPKYEMDGHPGALGPNVQDVNFDQLWNQTLPGLDLKRLAEELSRLGTAMVAEAVGSEKWAAADVVLSAAVEAQNGSGPRVLELLSRTNNWALETASTIGTRLAVGALKVARGVCTPQE
jgi:hypothetical protein